MTEGIEDNGDALSPTGMENLLRLLAGADRARLSSAQIDGRVVWIKRFDGKVGSFSKRLHHWVSPALPLVARSCAATSGEEALRREIRKAADFRAGGFLTPTIVYRNDAVLVTSDAGRIAEHAMWVLKKADDKAAHDGVLVEMTAALGRAHARGLCHGRPHPRDMFVRDGRWGFLDFEEEPEAIMPLAIAQARDVGVLFMQVVRHSFGEDTPAKAFAAYRAEAPAAVVAELRAMVERLAFLLPGLRVLQRLGLGNDGRAILGSIGFLRAALREPMDRQSQNKANGIGKTT